MNFFTRNKATIISLVSMFFLCNFIGWTTYNIITNWAPVVNTNTSVNYDALRNKFGNWFDLFFLTDHAIIMFTITGSMFFIFYKNNIYKTIFFCSIAYLVFNIFALTHFEWNSIALEPYGSYRTLVSHLVIPVTAFLILIWIRKDIYIRWVPLLCMSFYLTLFYFSLLILYYTQTITNNLGVKEHVTIYEFFDFNNNIMGLSMTNIWIRIFFIIFNLLCTPFIGLGIFMVFKAVFNIKIQTHLVHQKNLF